MVEAWKKQRKKKHAWCPLRLSCLIATSISEGEAAIAFRSSLGTLRTPLYTEPNPPSPIKSALLNPRVANLSSEKEKTRKSLARRSDKNLWNSAESEKSLDSESNSDLRDPKVEEATLRERAQESLEALEMTESSSSRVFPSAFEKWKHFIAKGKSRN